MPPAARAKRAAGGHQGDAYLSDVQAKSQAV